MDKPDCKGLLVLVVLPLDFLWGVPVVLWGDPVEKLSLLSIDEYKTFDVPDVGRLEGLSGLVNSVEEHFLEDGQIASKISEWVKVLFAGEDFLVLQ